MFEETKFRYWTDEEVKYLGENYKNKSYKEIADHLERTVASIKRKVHLERKKEREVRNNG